MVHDTNLGRNDSLSARRIYQVPQPYTHSLNKITDRIRDTLIQNMSLLEVLSWTRKTILKPPDWNLPDQPDLFGDFFC